MTTATAIIVPDRNEAKALTAWGFPPTPVPRWPDTLNFEFEASEALFEARRAYSLNQPVPVLSFIEASRHIDRLIHEHRQRQGVGR